jgi:hypothetical protein
VQFGYRYVSPLIVADGSEPPADDPMVYTPSAYPGCRAPHAWLAPGQSTLDLFGRDFVLLDLSTLNEEARRLYDKRYVLVRPDGHVAWRGDQPPAEAILKTARGE